MAGPLPGLGAFLRSFAESRPDTQSQMLDQMRQLATAQAQTIQAVTANQQLEAARSENELARMLAPSRIKLAQAQAKGQEAGAQKTIFEVEQLKEQAKQREEAIGSMAGLLGTLAPDQYKKYFTDPNLLRTVLSNPTIVSQLQTELASLQENIPGAAVQVQKKTLGAQGAEAELTTQRATQTMQAQVPAQEAATAVAQLKGQAEAAGTIAPQAQANLELTKAQTAEISDLLPFKKRLTEAQATLAEAKAKAAGETGVEPASVDDLVKLSKYRYKEQLIDKIVGSGIITDRAQAAAYVEEMGGPMEWLRSMKAIQDLLSIQGDPDFFTLFTQAMNLPKETSKAEINKAVKQLQQQYEELNTMYTALFGRRIGEVGATRRAQEILGEDRQIYEESLIK